MSCTHGDIFCRECALSNILAQKKEIKRLEKVRAQEERDAEERKALLDAEAHERAVLEFERTMSGLDGRAARASVSTSTTPAPAPAPTSGSRKEGSESATSGERKRKFEIDADEVQRIAADDRAKARKAIDEEKAAKPTLPSFWVPSVTPSSNSRDALHEVVKKSKTGPVCPASSEDRPHAYSLHGLIGIRFSTTAEVDDNGRGGTIGRGMEGNGSGNGDGKVVRICPACKKGLGNSSRAVLAKPCGHVLCGSCVEKFMKPNKHNHYDPHATEPEVLRCYVCDADLIGGDTEEEKKNNKKEKKKEKEKEKIKPGLVELRSEGTGYSAGGANQVRKNGVGAFQC